MAPAGFGLRVEGLNAVRAAAQGGRVVDLWVERSRLRAAADVLDVVRSNRGRVHEVDSLRDRAETEHHQGLVADCLPLAIATLDQLVETDRPALMVLDHIVDPHNLGA
ncbi:MAG: RNA methyltransferase substrate-binding domain-containing protein, partial [Acidimicrobiia bacterium]